MVFTQNYKLPAHFQLDPQNWKIPEVGYNLYFPWTHLFSSSSNKQKSDCNPMCITEISYLPQLGQAYYQITSIFVNALIINNI